MLSDNKMIPKAKNMEFVESCVIDAAKYIITLEQPEFESIFRRDEKYYKVKLNSKANKTEKAKIEKARAGERTAYYKSTISHLRKLLLSFDHEKKTIGLNIQYKQSFKCEFREFESRHYSCGASIQKMTRVMRNFLLDGYAEELDISSSHPSSAKYYARLYNIDDIDFLDEFLSDKKAAMSKYKFTKDDFNVMMYKDLYDDPKCEFLKEIHSELTTIKNKIIKKNKEQYDEYKQWYIQNKPDKHNPKSSYCGLKFEIAEFKIITTLLSFCSDKSDILFPLHDALMLKIGSTEKYNIMKQFDDWKKLPENKLYDHFKIDIKSCKSDIEIPDGFEPFDIPRTKFELFKPECEEMDKYVRDYCDTVVRYSDDKFYVFDPIDCIFKKNKDKCSAAHSIYEFVLPEFELHKWFVDKEEYEKRAVLINSKYMKICNHVAKLPEAYLLFNQNRGSIPIKNNKVYLDQPNDKGEKIIDRIASDKWAFYMPFDYLTDEEYDAEIGYKYFCGLFVPDLGLEMHKSLRKEDLDYAVVDVIVNYLYTIMCGYKLRYFLTITGTGRNGKSLFMEFIQKLLNDVSDNISRNAIMHRQNKDHKNEDIQCMCSNYLVVCDETDEKDQLDAPVIKQLVDDIETKKVNIRALNKDTEKKSIRSNIWAVSNYNLRVHGGTTEKAVFDRMKAVKACNVREVDPGFNKKILDDDFVQIANFILRNGKIITAIEDTPSMLKAKKEAAESSNIILTFIQSCDNYEFTEVVDPEQSTTGFNLTKFKQHLKSWAKQRDSKIYQEVTDLVDSKQKFTPLMNSMGLCAIKDTRGQPKREGKDYMYSGLTYTANPTYEQNDSDDL